MKKRGCHAPKKQTTGNVCIANMQTPPRGVSRCARTPKNKTKLKKFITLTSRHTALPLTKSQEVLSPSHAMPSHHRTSSCISSVISPRREEKMKCVDTLPSLHWVPRGVAPLTCHHITECLPASVLSYLQEARKDEMRWYAYRRGGFESTLCERSILGGLGSLVHQNYRFCNEACFGNDVRGDKSTEKKESIVKD
ncbi:hypothetical protein CDAR_387491 [Caerostris darwini]|uniref:Uncharacterized protein n=1 Tax=Caerostris darwini TaxID=1538125 RepID=A0AAV4TSI3_9ARAC|nr:hypothetical protein CDAR_387491 [Caerostris darwini]